MQIKDFLTFENIYLCVNLGILPFWLMLIIIPNSKFTHFFLNSIVLPLILSSAYIYILYQAILLEHTIFDFFNAYTGLENLYTAFASENFLLIFWLHFLALNIFLASWISKDAIKYSLPRPLVAVPLVVVYFMGPIGLVLYWFIRIFYAKRISLHD